MSAAVAVHPKTPTPARRQSEDEACPVAALADEASDLIAAWKGLNAATRQSDTNEWCPFGPTIGEPAADEDDEELSVKAVRNELRDRIRAVVTLAAHRRATSAKGAAFQALTINWQLTIMLDTGLDAGAVAERLEDMNDAYRHAERALGSIVDFLERAAGGLPLHLVEYFLMSPSSRTGDAADRAMQHFTTA